MLLQLTTLGGATDALADGHLCLFQAAASHKMRLQYIGLWIAVEGVLCKLPHYTSVGKQVLSMVCMQMHVHLQARVHTCRAFWLLVAC